MTTEEIEKAVSAFLDSREFTDYIGDCCANRVSVTPDDEVRGALTASLRALVSKVFEEAAQIAETWGAEDDEPTDPDVAFGCLAAAIRARALADSIKTEGEK